MGWFAQEGLDVEVVPLTGSTTASNSWARANSCDAAEHGAWHRPAPGGEDQEFLHAYQTPGYAIAVPVDSPIQKLSDLKGKTIGVTNMASAASSSRARSPPPPV